MNYSQALGYLDSFLNLEKLSQFPQNSFFNLRRMEHLLRIAGFPDKKFIPVLIAGTTGKGSTGFFLESILRENRIPVGYYHSPHVEDIRERVRLDGAKAPKILWARGLTRIKALLAKHPLPAKLGRLTYFEIMTFLAILVFSETGREIGIFEIGLGGRLDATNVLNAPLVILTPIHFDHTHFLGNTIAKIAREKAGIIKKGSFVVTVRQTSEAARVIKKVVRDNDARLIRAGIFRNRRRGLPGDFQDINAGAAVRAAEILRSEFDFRIDPRSYSGALSGKNWPGRLECFSKWRRTFVLDGAHNPVSIGRLVKTFRPASHLPGQGSDGRSRFRRSRKWLVFGAMQDKDSGTMLRVLSCVFDKIILTGVQCGRAKAIRLLAEEAKDLFKVTIPAQNVGEAFCLVEEISDPGDLVLVTGSFYLVGEARKILKFRTRNISKQGTK